MNSTSKVLTMTFKASEMQYLFLKKKAKDQETTITRLIREALAKKWKVFGK